MESSWSMAQDMRWIKMDRDANVQTMIRVAIALQSGSCAKSTGCSNGSPTQGLLPPRWPTNNVGGAGPVGRACEAGQNGGGIGEGGRGGEFSQMNCDVLQIGPEQNQGKAFARAEASVWRDKLCLHVAPASTGMC